MGIAQGAVVDPPVPSSGVSDMPPIDLDGGAIRVGRSTVTTTEGGR
ncbi:hypothetical protein [Mycobacterium phage Bassalto]|uniref:Uncharacterized protein n=1 Tax=Mycobacterium phage Gadjet TaxID=1089122 RepID=G8I3U4_9CAUD|nr:hypothetical protein CM02_gp064 [Mycobacterium phage Gadjet]QYW01171.1 hypothetical protein SEA_YINZ_63 [Mycobacterium phage Yinz]UYL86515.1 hypothetical protein SEA_BRIAKILA_62 [Mycobacterium phage Briakila]WAK44026.1 hypothetical protein [Mycobacterium phage Bassalto]WGH21847.1 hypothetical protein SEA_CASBAH_63 [Mycobacterium phage Casbah]WNA13608.1 hypothetical protein SEA_PHAYETA_65 [Mycobacterium phage Phayeta]